jgi:hypothetical protein
VGRGRIVKFSIGTPPHEFEILPGFWLAQIGWFVVNFTMGFVGVGWPNIYMRWVATVAIVAISAYNVTVDNKGLLEKIITRE